MMFEAPYQKLKDFMTIFFIWKKLLNLQSFILLCKNCLQEIELFANVVFPVMFLKCLVPVFEEEALRFPESRFPNLATWIHRYISAFFTHIIPVPRVVFRFIDWRSSYHVRKYRLPAFSIGKQWEAHCIHPWFSFI